MKAAAAGLVLVAIAVLAAAGASAAPTGFSSAAHAPRAVVSVNHVAPHQCGVKQSSFARICRAGAHTACLRAVKRKVKGFSNLICAQRQTACRSCLSQLRTCITKIGHAKRMDYSCEECTGKFSRCIGKRYPKID